MEVNDLHVGRKLQVSSGIGAAVAGGAAAPSPPAVCFSAVSGSAWIENGLLVGNPIAFPSPVLEAQLMVGRAPTQNVTATAISVLKVSNRASPFALTGSPTDIMLGDPLGPCGISAYTGPAQPFVIAGKDLLFTHISAQLHAMLVKQQTTASKNETDAAATETNNKAKNGTGVKNGADVKNAVSTSAGPKVQVATPVAGASDVTTLNTTLNTVDAITKAHTISIATKKPFDIPHPSKPGWRLRHVCLEGPESGVYYRGRLTNNTIISLPDYWEDLVDPDTITVTLTQIGSSQDLIVHNIESNKRVVIRSGNFSKIDCYYMINGERKDGEKLIVEYEGQTPADYPGNNDEYSVAGYHYDRR